MAVVAPSATPTISNPNPKTLSQDSSFQTTQKRQLSILDPSRVTTEYHELAFNGAAAKQITTEHGSGNYGNDGALLIASPYNDLANLLNVKNLDTQSALLALALTEFKPIKDDYAIGDYRHSFNWDHILSTLRYLTESLRTNPSFLDKIISVTAQNNNPSPFEWKETSFYIVAFHSKLSPDADRDFLGQLDQDAHAEAMASGGGLLKYWFGSANDSLQNLATCVWSSREEALHAVRAPAHKKAMQYFPKMYSDHRIDIWKLTIAQDASSYSISKWFQ